MKGVLNRKLLVTLIAVLVVALSCALFVSCKANLYLVSAEYDAGGGTVELRDGKGNVAEKIEEGATVTVKVTPNDGYEVTAFKVTARISKRTKTARIRIRLRRIPYSALRLPLKVLQRL